jgi:hypothetical protein
MGRITKGRSDTGGRADKPNRRLRNPRLRLPDSRRQWVALAAVVVIGAGTVTFAVARLDDPAEAATAAVRDFFDARSAGDCERLVDLVSEDSWSRAGQLDRAGFVARCDVVVDAYAPRLTDARPVTTGDDRAAVAVEIPADEPPPVPATPSVADGIYMTVENDPEADPSAASDATVHATATLVREGGDWKVETDLEVLRLGRSPQETLQAYYEAWFTGGCDVVVDLVTGEAWAAAGASGRGDYIERCRARAERMTRPEDPLPLPRFHPGERDGRNDDAEGTDRLTAVAEADFGVDRPPETITMVADGLDWRLTRDVELVGVLGLRSLAVDEPAPTYRSASEDLVLPPDDALTTGFADIEGTNPLERRTTAGFRRGVVTRYEQLGLTPQQITVALYEFDTADGASRYATSLAEHVASSSTGPAAQLPSLRATDERPYLTATRCGTDCTHPYEAIGIDVRDNHLVVVEQAEQEISVPAAEPPYTTADRLELVRTALRAQLENL